MSTTTAPTKRPRRAAVPVEPPSPYRIMEAMRQLHEAHERLLAIDPDMADDPQLFGDMLEGESKGDPFAVIERIVRAGIDAEYSAEDAATRAKDLTARKARFEKRHATARDLTLMMLGALGLPRMERPDFTITRVVPAKGKVTITDADKVPDGFCKIETVRTPQKSLIADAVDAGDDCPEGAVIGNPEPYLLLKKR
jgi:hypothetical protein